MAMQVKRGDMTYLLFTRHDCPKCGHRMWPYWESTMLNEYDLFILHKQHPDDGWDKVNASEPPTSGGRIVPRHWVELRCWKCRYQLDEPQMRAYENEPLSFTASKASVAEPCRHRHSPISVAENSDAQVKNQIYQCKICGKRIKTVVSSKQVTNVLWYLSLLAGALTYPRWVTVINRINCARKNEVLLFLVLLLVFTWWIVRLLVGLFFPVWRDVDNQKQMPENKQTKF